MDDQKKEAAALPKAVAETTIPVQNNLLQSEEGLRLVWESIRDYALFTEDANGIVTSWNAGAERVLLFSANDIIGHSGDVIFTPEDRAEHAPEQERQTARAVGRAEDERWHVRKNGSRFFASGVMHSIRDADGTLRGFVKVMRDLTERKEAEQALQAANDTLEERVRERTDALSRMSVSQRDLLRQIVTAQEAERGRIARELHDEMGQHTAALLLGLNTFKTASLSPEQNQTLRQLTALVNEVAKQVHQIAFSLRPTALDDMGLTMALHNYVEEWSRWSKLPVQLAITGLDAERLPPELETTLYRFVQEALTNVLRHADGASSVSVLVQKIDGHVSAIVEDNGCGFDAEAAAHKNKRFGLLGMRERIALAGGTFSLESTPGEGTAVFARLPLPPHEADARNQP